MGWFNPTGGIRKLRSQIQFSEAIPQLTLIGVIVGLATGLVMIAFRMLIEAPLSQWFNGQPDNFESLPFWLRFALPVLGALVLAAIWVRLPLMSRRVGVTHVIEQLNNNSGRMPAGNILVQFFSAALALITGQSVGREGPAIHLGAGVASILGQRVNLPNHSMQTLVGCGVAAAIAASFNTPIAGVIFSMEVILMEYTLAGFIPIIAAATSATLVSRLVYGSSPAFLMPPVEMASLSEIPWLILAGIALGSCAALFNRLIRAFLRYQYLSIWARFGLAGLATGLLAMVVPEVMGTGYDTVTDAINGQLAIATLVVILSAKILATSVAVGLGMPAGLIGPTFVMGACLGGLFGIVIEQADWLDSSGSAFYALMGMGAMMSAVLQAPLAALMAVMELTSNSQIIFPAMLTVIIANLTSQHFFKQPSIFSSILAAQGLSSRTTPVAKAMRGISALRMAKINLPIIPAQTHSNKLDVLLEQHEQIIIQSTEEPHHYLVSREYLQHKLDEIRSVQTDTGAEEAEDISLNLQDWLQPSQMLIWQPSHVNLEQVLRSIQGKEAAGVVLAISPNSPPEGIISTEQLLNYLSSLGEK